MPEQLNALLARSAARWSRHRFALLGFSFGTAGLAILLTFLVLDRCYLLSDWQMWLVRGGLVLLLAAAGWQAWQAAQEKLSPLSLALVAEQNLATPRNHLVNAAYFVHYQQEPLLADSVMAELTPDEWRQADQTPLGQRQRLRVVRRVFVACAAGIAGVVALDPTFAAGSFTQLAIPGAGGRMSLVTRVGKVMPGDVTVKPGDACEVRADILGPEATAVSLEIREAKKPLRQEEMTLWTEPATDGEEPAIAQPWGFRFKELYQPVEYRVHTGRSRSPWFAISIATAPALLDWEGTVTPPAYTRLQPFPVSRKKADEKVLCGSTLSLTGKANTPLQKVFGMAKERQVDAVTQIKGDGFTLATTIPETTELSVRLTSLAGLETTCALPLVLIQDMAPTIVLVDTPAKIKATPLSKIEVRFKADDDWGVARVGLEKVGTEGRLDGVKPLVPAKNETPRQFADRFPIEVPRLGLQTGQTIRLRLYAEDNRPPGQLRRGFSLPFEVTVEDVQEKAKERQNGVENSANLLATLVRMQQENLNGTRKVSEDCATDKPIATAPIENLLGVQKKILEQAKQLLAAPAALGDLAAKLAGVAEKEMPQAVAALDRACQGRGGKRKGALDEAAILERQILTVLMGSKDSLDYEAKHSNLKDLLTLFRQIVAKQQKNLTETLAAGKKDKPAPQVRRDLARVQDQIAGELTGFREQAEVLISSAARDDDFADKLRAACKLIDESKVYEKAVTAAEQLEDGDFAQATALEKETLTWLLKALDILNKWTSQQAKELVEKASEKLKELAELLKELEEKQTKIANATRDMGRDGKLDEPEKQKLKDMDKEQEAMAELIEKMAQDLYQFPDLPVCNELNSKMREIFEDVQQALGSDKAPAVEIAVQKEDALLDAIRNTKKRVEDIEMWLPDVPDNIAWNMESFDADEFPNMPLVPLPDELEDIVGDLLEQAKDIEQAAQDATGNNMMADGEMGWGIGDGPMPNFSAKGKSGNTKPQDNEMTGRSGAGREGQSNGELVENKVKGLEGTQTHTRFTKDALQKGFATEEDGSTLKARATGGGKLGGVSESIGLFGKAPRRDLNMSDHSGGSQPLRQEAEATYTAARLLYLESGRLGQAVEGMREMEKAKSLPAFQSLGKKVVRRLQDSQVEVASGTAMPIAFEGGQSSSGSTSVTDFDLNQIPDENYREMIRNFFRGLDNVPKSP